MVYLKTTYELCFGEAYFEYFESCDFSREKYKYRCIRIYVWFKDDKHVIWMWIWFILKNVSLPDRIWSMWLVRFAHSPPNFIFWLSRLIASLTRHQTSYSGSAGWYFRYQSIHIQITYTYHNNPSISVPLFSLWLILMVIVLAIFWKEVIQCICYIWLLINFDLLDFIWSNLSIQYKNFHWANTAKTSPIRIFSVLTQFQSVQ